MSEADITVLTQGIARLLDLNSPQDKLDKYIKQLRVACFGPAEDKLSKYFGRELSSGECLDCLLSLDMVLDRCLSHSGDGLRLALCVAGSVSLSNTAVGFLSTLLPTLVRSIPVEDIKPALQALWKHQEVCRFPVTLLECLLLERQRLEEVLIRTYLKLVDSPDNLLLNNVWDSSLRYWAQASASSPFIFQSISTILNNLLVNANNRPVMLKIISNYIQCVNQFSSDIISLYPIEYQSVVSILMSSPDTYQHLSNEDLEMFVSKMINPYLSEPHICLMLLSHFPKWLGLLNDFITSVDLGVT